LLLTEPLVDLAIHTALQEAAGNSYAVTTLSKKSINYWQRSKLNKKFVGDVGGGASMRDYLPRIVITLDGKWE
jgi:hypothetical protein